MAKGVEKDLRPKGLASWLLWLWVMCDVCATLATVKGQICAQLRSYYSAMIVGRLLEMRKCGRSQATQLTVAVLDRSCSRREEK